MSEEISMPGVKRNAPRKTRVNRATPSELPVKSVLNQLIDSRLMPLPQGVPQTEEAKQIFIINLVRLREQRLTKPECAAKLGVSESTISRYINEPAFRETQETMIGDAKEMGHVLISELIADAVGVLYELMSDQQVSPFVRYKAATELLDKAGYGEPRDEAQADSRAGVVEFLKDVEEKKKQQNIYIENLNITPEKEGSPMIVESDALVGVPLELRPYYQMVKAGGSLPDEFKVRQSPPVRDRIENED
jgi:transcriptional regulator with XRE-family HTH domain